MLRVSKALAVAVLLSAGAAHAQTVTMAMSSAPTSVDPHYHTFNPNETLDLHIFDRLVERDTQSNPIPGLATSWTLLDDTTWEVKLRQDVKFHDGSPFTAADVVYNFDRIPKVVNSPGSFAISSAAATVTDGNTASQSITVTPSGGFTGSVNLSLTTSVAIANACYTVTNATISGTTAATATATIYTNASNCPGGANVLLKSGGTKHAEATPQPLPGRSVPVGLAMAGLLAVGFAGRKSRKLRGVIAVALLAMAGFAISGCGSTSTAGAGISTLAPKGTTTVTVTGTDAVTGLKSASTTFVLTIQ